MARKLIDYQTTLGEVIRYPRPSPEVAAFLARAKEAAEDPAVSEGELISLVYGTENPILEQGRFPGRGAVTAKVLRDPVYHVLQDLLQHKRIALGHTTADALIGTFTVPVSAAAEELGINSSAVRQAIAANKLSARKGANGQYLLDPRSIASYRLRVQKRGPEKGPALRIRMGNRPGQSFRVKAPGLHVTERRKEGDARIVDAEVPSFESAAIGFSGRELNRCFILAPAARIFRYELGPFYVEGRFKIAEKVNDAKRASERFKAFEPR